MNYQVIRTRFFAIVAAAFCTLTLLSPAVASAADTRVAFVNTGKILEQAPQAVMARERLQKEFAPRDVKIAAMQKKLKADEAHLDKDGSIMSEDARNKLERDVLSQQRDVKRARDEFNEDLNIRRGEEFSKLQKLVADVVVKVAKEEHYDIVLENGVVYASERVDITDQVIERLKQSANNKH